MQFRGATRVQVKLTLNNVTRLLYTREDYGQAVGGSSVSRADVSLGGRLACDCRTYWAARALRERPDHVTLSAACADGRSLSAVPLDQLQCAAPGLCAGTRCTCAWLHSGVSPARVLRVHCEHAGLTRVSHVLGPLTSALRRNGVAPDEYDWQLYLAHNSIAELDAADFPKYLSVSFCNNMDHY